MRRYLILLPLLGVLSAFGCHSDKPPENGGTVAAELPPPPSPDATIEPVEPPSTEPTQPEAVQSPQP
jgi:hypothetical protein